MQEPSYMRIPRPIYNKYEERDTEEMEKSTNTIANLIFFAGNSQPYSPHYCMSAYNR